MYIYIHPKYLACTYIIDEIHDKFFLSINEMFT